MPSRRHDHDSLAWLAETFAYARVVDKDSCVLELAAGHADSSIMLNDESVLARPDAAMRQIDVDAAAEREFTDRGGRIFTPPGVQPPLGRDNLVVSGDGRLTAGRVSVSGTRTVTPSAPRLPRRFYDVVELDLTRLNKQVPEVVEHVVEHLTRLTGASVRVKLEIDADVPMESPARP